MSIECSECKKMKKAMYSAKDEAQGKRAALRKIADAINEETKSEHDKIDRIIDILQISGAWIKPVVAEAIEDVH